MSMHIPAALAVLAILLPYAKGVSATEDTGFHAVTLVDLAHPVPPAWLERAGIDYVYASAPATEIGPEGAPVIAGEAREQWERLLELYAGSGVRILVMGNFYLKPAIEHQARDLFGRLHPMACFRQPGFQDEMSARIIGLARALSAYPAFGGFAFDDGAHVRVDCCYCDLCRAQFAAEYGLEPPGFAPRAGTGRVPADDRVLAWEEFQRASWEMYLRTQADAVRAVSPDLLMVTIPSDSYFYGRFLNVDVAPEETILGHSALLQRIERIQPRHWTIFQSFPLARLPETGESGLQPWAVGAHITADSPKMLMQHEGPYAPVYQRIQYMSPAEIERMGRVTITEGAGGLCWWTPAAPLPSYPAAFDAMAEVARDVERIEGVLAERRPEPARIGLLYSTTTEVLEQPWRSNTAERWQHLHAFEGIAYSLLRANLPLEFLMEDELTPEKLRGLRGLVVPAVRFLRADIAEAIERAIAETGLVALAAGECLHLRGMVRTDCDPLIWHTWASRGYRQEQYANLQWLEARNALLPHLLPLASAPVRVYSDRAIARHYGLPGGDLLLLVASWDLDNITEAAIEGEGRATDLLSGRELGPVEEIGRLTINPAGWRVLRIER